MKSGKEKRKILGFSEKISVSELILFCIFKLQNNNEVCSFERLLKECFILFPGMFGFEKYPKWPDSRKIDRPLRTLRNKKLVLGSPKTFFSLTQSGRKETLSVERILTQQKLF